MELSSPLDPCGPAVMSGPNVVCRGVLNELSFIQLCVLTKSGLATDDDLGDRMGSEAGWGSHSWQRHRGSLVLAVTLAITPTDLEALQDALLAHHADPAWKSFDVSWPPP